MAFVNVQDDHVYCRNCNEQHWESEIKECQSCQRDCCPSCSDAKHDDWHRECLIAAVDDPLGSREAVK